VHNTDDVFYALILSKVWCAMCVYGGHLTVTQKNLGGPMPFYVECTDIVLLARYMTLNLFC